MRQEDIDFLIRSNIPVTKFNLDNIDKAASSRNSFQTGIASGSFNLDKNGMNDMYNYTTTLFMDGIDKKIPIRKRVFNLLEEIDEDVKDINRGISNLREESASSSVLEPALSGEIETLLIDFSDSSIVSPESEGIIIQNDLIFADATTELANKESIRLEKYNFSSLTALMRSRQAADIAKIELVSESGIGYFPEPDMDVINNDIRFRIEGESDIDISRSIDLIIDRKDSSSFNQIEILLEKAHMMSAYSSEDGEEYTLHTGKPTYVKDSTLQINPTTDRYIKLVFHKITYDNVHNGNNVYVVTINSLSLLRTTFMGTSTLITNPIETSGAYSKLAISVCDCISEGLNGEISYFISLNGQDWESIRPVNRHEGDELHKSSVININAMVENKFILLEERESIDGRDNYTLLLPEDFLRSNYLRTFANNITYSPNDWIYNRGLYSAVGILYEEKIIDFGPNEISLNGKWITGEIRLMPNIYRIEIRSDNYLNVILNRKNNITDIGNGEYAVESDDGSIRTVLDSLYPYNHKYIIEKEFDYIFEKELIEKEDYNLYNKDSGYYLSTTESYDNIIIAYRLHESNVNSIQLKAELQSGDFVTIPYIEKIIIRLA
ncbi:MAG: hypothetical protein DRQ78_00740 [Epsilonproteobacteria bacterium]|nr:MAG: hypothetical protein DRQ78_00740 [Campylobacterota bacterium]